MLDMAGHVDSVFRSVPATRTPYTGTHDADGIFQRTAGAPVPHNVNIQPASDREIQSLAAGGERITDVRRIYVNDGLIAGITPADIWAFDEGHGMQQWKCAAMDCRPWRNYCKLIVVRIDDQG